MKTECIQNEYKLYETFICLLEYNKFIYWNFPRALFVVESLSKIALLKMILILSDFFLLKILQINQIGSMGSFGHLKSLLNQTVAHKSGTFVQVSPKVHDQLSYTLLPYPPLQAATEVQWHNPEHQT